MKALVYLGPGLKAIEDRPKPQKMDGGDAIAPDPGHGVVRMARTTIRLLALEAS